MKEILEQLLAQQILICPKEGTPLYQDNHGNIMSTTGKVYQIENSAIDLFANYEEVKSFPKPPKDFLIDITRKLALNDKDEQIIDSVSRAVQTTLLVPKGSKDLHAEIRELASRMRLEEPENWPSPGIGLHQEKYLTKTNQDIKIKLLKYAVRDQILVGSQHILYFTLINNGSSILSSQHEYPFLLSYHWVNSQRRIIEFEGLRSPLPKDIMPGERITVGVVVRAPEILGRYILAIRALQEELQWYEDSGLNLTVRVTDGNKPGFSQGKDNITLEHLNQIIGLKNLSQWINNFIKKGRLHFEVPQNANVRILRNYMNGQILAGSRQFFSFRVKNEGAYTLSSYNTVPFLLSYSWADSNGTVLELDEELSPLPRDLIPGEEVTVIMAISAPNKPGKYTLKISSFYVRSGSLEDHFQGYKSWALDIPTDVVPAITHSLTHVMRNEEPFDYEKDCQAVREILVRQFPEKPDNSRYRLLELGGGVYPQAMFLSKDRADLISVDISFAQCQLGSIIFSQDEDLKDHFQYIAADAHNLPLANKSMDGIIICAALHHFPDPIQLLSSLHRVLKCNGKLIIVREPCNPNPLDTQYLRDIRLGISEQQWNLQEYAYIFESSGFIPEYALVRSGCSLMVVLKSARDLDSHSSTHATG